jgi:hypothetical protein
MPVVLDDKEAEEIASHIEEVMKGWADETWTRQSGYWGPMCGYCNGTPENKDISEESIHSEACQGKKFLAWLRPIR